MAGEAGYGDKGPRGAAAAAVAGNLHPWYYHPHLPLLTITITITNYHHHRHAPLLPRLDH